MKRTLLAFATILAVFVAVFAVLIVRSVPKVKAQHGCSDHTLRGYYGLTAFGNFEEKAFMSLAGLVAFDGKGNLAGNVNLTLNGTVQPGLAITGATYTVSPTCTITASGIIVNTLDLTLYGTVLDATGGSEVTTDVEGDHVTGTADIKKIRDW